MQTLHQSSQIILPKGLRKRAEFRSPPFHEMGRPVLMALQLRAGPMYRAGNIVDLFGKRLSSVLGRGLKLFPDRASQRRTGVTRVSSQVARMSRRLGSSLANLLAGLSDSVASGLHTSGAVRDGIRFVVVGHQFPPRSVC